MKCVYTKDEFVYLASNEKLRRFATSKWNFEICLNFFFIIFSKKIEIYWVGGAIYIPVAKPLEMLLVSESRQYFFPQ